MLPPSTPDESPHTNSFAGVPTHSSHPNNSPVHSNPAGVPSLLGPQPFSFSRCCVPPTHPASNNDFQPLARPHLGPTGSRAAPGEGGLLWAEDPHWAGRTPARYRRTERKPTQPAANYLAFPGLPNLRSVHRAGSSRRQAPLGLRRTPRSTLKGPHAPDQFPVLSRGFRADRIGQTTCHSHDASISLALL